MSRVGQCLTLLSLIGFALLPSIATAEQAMPPRFVVSQLETQQRDIAVAYNFRRREYLVVWTNWWSSEYSDIYAQRISWDGRLIGWFAVSYGPHRHKNSSVAYDSFNDRYLVVWSYDVNDDLEYDLYGRFIPWYGPDPTLSEFEINGWAGEQGESVTVYNSLRREFLVLWTNRISSIPYYLSGRRVWADGSGFPVSPFTVFSSATDWVEQPDLVYNGARDQYLVTFTRLVNGIGSQGDVSALRLSGTGGVLGGGELAIATGAGQEQDASVAWCPLADRYFVVWYRRDFDSSARDVFGRFVEGDGLVIGLSEVVRYSGGASSPDVSCLHESNEYLVVWEEREPYAQGGLEKLEGRRVPADLNWNIPMGPVFIVGPRSINGPQDAVVTSGQAGWLVTWVNTRQNSSSGNVDDIHARLAWQLFSDGFESGDSSVWTKAVP